MGRGARRAGLARRQIPGLPGRLLNDLLPSVRRADAPRPDAPNPRGRHNPRTPTRTDRIKEHLTDRDLDAARRELNGEVVAQKADGTPWDHVDEVRNAQRGLRNRVRSLQKQLSDPNLSAAERAAAQSELSEASRLLDYSRQFVP